MEKILDLSKLPKEVLLILEFLKEEREITTQKKLAKEVDWQLFIDFTVHHRVYPLLYQKLSKSEEPLVPDFVLDRLKQLYQRNTLKMLQLTGEMTFINSLLHQNNIQVIFLKGPILAKDLYGDISLRTSGDLDFLIPINQLDNTERILIANGYIKNDDFSSVLNDWKFRRHHVTFIHPFNKTTLEIHWRLHPWPTKEERFSDLWGRKISYNISPLPIYHLGRKDLLQYLIEHGSRHGWYRLRWLVDIQKLVLQHPYKNREMVFPKNNYYEVQFNQALILLNELLNLSLKKGDLNYLNKNTKKFAQEAIYFLERKENSHSSNGDTEHGKYHYLISNLMFPDKFFRLISKFYPSSADIMTIKFPRYLHFLYFLLRPFLVVYRWFKKPIIGNTK